MERMINLKIRDDFLRNEQELKEQECKVREQQFFRIHSYCEGREIHRHRICKGQVEHFQWHSLANLPTMQSSIGGYTALVFLLQHKNLDFSAAIHPSIFLLARDLRTPFRHSNQFNCNKVNSLVAI